MREPRRVAVKDEQQVERWLISYADFITLLFAFFVVMYSIAESNEDKYKDLADSLIQAFETPFKSLDPIQVGEVSRSQQPITGDDLEQPEVNQDNQEAGNLDSENYASTEEFKDLENGLKESLGGLINQDLAEISSDSNWININLRSGLLFPSGSAVMSESATPLIEEVSKHLNTNDQLILVHGHTDNIPINSQRYPSNWELSSSRAVAVVRKLQELSVLAPRMSVEGHAEYQPIASNNTAEGRAKNRRVVVSISRKMKISEQQKVNQSNKTKLIQQKDSEPEFKIHRLPGGGILIRNKTPNA